MRIPQSFKELLEERILFCEVQLHGSNSILCCQRKSEMLIEFEIAYNDFKELKSLLETFNEQIEFNAQLKRRFKESSKVMFNTLITTTIQQMQGECNFQSLHNSMNLIEGLQVIIAEVDAM